MAAAENISVALTPEFAADIRQAVAVEQLQHLWSDGVSSGESIPLDGDAIKRRGRERSAALKADQR